MMDSTKLSEALTDFHVLEPRPTHNEHGERDIWDAKRKAERRAARKWLALLPDEDDQYNDSVVLGIFNRCDPPMSLVQILNVLDAITGNTE